MLPVRVIWPNYGLLSLLHQPLDIILPRLQQISNCLFTSLVCVQSYLYMKFMDFWCCMPTVALSMLFIPMWLIPSSLTTTISIITIPLSSHIPKPHFPKYLAQHYLTIEAPLSLSDTPHYVRLLLTKDQPVARTSTWKHTTIKRDGHSCLHQDLNPFSQQASGRRPTPHTARLFGSVNYQLTENQNIKLVSLSALFEYSVCLGCCAFSSIA